MTQMFTLPTILRRRRKEAGAASLVMLSIVGAATLVVPRASRHSWPTAIAHEGSLTETLVEPGTLSSARLLLYGSSIAGVQAKIVEIVPEGRSVAPGDVLIRFDATTFQQNLLREEAALRQAEAEHLRAQEELRIERLRTEGDMASARQQIDSAETELANQTDGKGRLAIAEAEAAESDAASELDRARKTFEDMKPMLARGFITRVELDRAEQAMTHADDLLRLARLRHDTLSKFERPAATARSQSDVDSARQALNRQRETAQARLSEHESAVRIAASRIDEIRARVTLLNEQVARATVLAEAEGLVVYRELFFGNDKRKPQVGDEVWSNQPLIALPDFSHLTVETRIREIDLHHVQAGGRVKVTLPAYPGLEIPGAVELVGALAEQDPSRAGSKFFPVTVTLEGHDPRLRTGMTAQVSIETAATAHATLVPVQAIVEVDGTPTVFVDQGGRIASRTVVIVAETNREAAISDGVSAGDVVLLADPRQATAAQTRN